jgi:hypothetical protein
MFTEDNKMIIKSMSSKDFYSFIEIKDKYFKYIENNKTYISKIYGIYRFLFKDYEEKYEHILVLRNIAGIV